MANIFLTKKCNLKCPYCFADEFVNKENEEMTLESFYRVLDFVKTSNREIVGLIGGEPTLHSHFSEILKFLIEDNKVRKAVIYTNGLEIDKYIDLIKHPKFSLLINCNSKNSIGNSNYEKLVKNIELLISNNKNDFNLGINIYPQIGDYSYIFDLLKIAKKNILRFSLSIPNIDKETENDVINSFAKNKKLLLEFWKDCYKNSIAPYNDCNSFPSCILDTEMKRVLLDLNKLSIKYKIEGPILTQRICNPVIDILPDLTAIRCFGMSKSERVSISDFKSIENLRNYFFNKIDLYARLAKIADGCANCKVNCIDKCGICFTYKLKSIEKIKNIIEEK